MQQRVSEAVGHDKYHSVQCTVDTLPFPQPGAMAGPFFRWVGCCEMLWSSLLPQRRYSGLKRDHLSKKELLAQFKATLDRL